MNRLKFEKDRKIKNNITKNARKFFKMIFQDLFRLTKKMKQPKTE